MKCTHLIVSGKVQGVFFRSNVRDKAQELELTGYVKNLEDGAVEIIVQGKEKPIDQLIDYIRSNPGVSKVKDVKIQYKEPETFSDFEIR